MAKRGAKNASFDTKAASACVDTPQEKLSASRATNYTNAITLEMIDVGGKKGNGARLCICDAAALRAGEPGRNHALSTFQNRAVLCFKLPAVPGGVEVYCPTGLKGPLASDNPTNGASWAFVATPFAVSAAKAKKAVEFASTLGIQLVKQAILTLDIDVPAADKKSAWKATSELLQQRVKITRTGEKIAGGTYTVHELVNMRVALADNLPKEVLKTWTTLCKDHVSLMNLNITPAGAVFSSFSPTATLKTTTSPASTAPARASTSTAPARKRPAAATVRTPVKKKKRRAR